MSTIPNKEKKLKKFETFETFVRILYIGVNKNPLGRETERKSKRLNK